MPKGSPPESPRKIQITKLMQQLMEQQPQYGAYANQVLAERQVMKEWAHHSLKILMEDPDIYLPDELGADLAKEIKEGTCNILPITPTEELCESLGLTSRVQKELVIFRSWFNIKPSFLQAREYKARQHEVRRYGMDILATMSDAQIDAEMQRIENMLDAASEWELGREISRIADSDYDWDD